MVWNGLDVLEWFGWFRFSKSQENGSNTSKAGFFGPRGVQQPRPNFQNVENMAQKRQQLFFLAPAEYKSLDHFFKNHQIINNINYINNMITIINNY